MPWNQPGNNGDNRDPWGSSSNNGDNSAGNKKKGRDIKRPLSLGDIFVQFINKLSSIRKKRIDSNLPGRHSFYLSMIIIAIIVIWSGSGFYTIKEAERGVVLRFGKFSYIVQPGLNWRPTFVDKVIAVNVESVRELAASGVMLTSDENVVRVEMNVQYQVIDPERYLFSVIYPDDSLRQATDSALRGVIGKYTMDRILTEGRTVVRSDTQRVLEETIQPYNMGMTLLDVNFQAARPPEEVKMAFDDAIAARENEQQYIREAEAYSNEVQPRANGQAQRILEEGKAYKARTILEAEGEVQRFTKVLPEYKAAPEITRERLYIDSMERILKKNRKVLINDKNNKNLLIFPIEDVARDKSISNQKDKSAVSDTMHLFQLADNNMKIKNPTSREGNPNISVIDQRQANTQRNNTTREGRG
ncbi:HflK protein [secondary endosymbiont of Heteropsylla cubana]|uniref:Protein HflK n=1 Tax=secondary endosymbiont of Heteropsylla cubana TaxID=134287 RepID=J3VTZ3_9ENTR|nr:FtsH protease activity modulator HflK [secondary endosymbiont of Heteropsylla cubana]AFP85536.1 HflK protein [secondary endosymbiont of Heteropsylla cubana]